ncbi:flagellar export protein FliJ [Methyloversatilis thermotolerans]|uniref:flagellar export protein FliJ n=1 Tax=Methyloversatilis thermotolerans TaxID=1346290 RepID=UPI000375BC75|nr:flagellar export protein FliJ [Methyloversatilis thermotolerans]
MADQFRLQSILDLSVTRMDEAARALATLMANEKDHSRRLDMLEQYRNEYQNQFMEAARSGLTPNQWANYRAFLARIDDAIVMQQRQVERSRDLTQAGQREWLDTRTRVKAFETLSDRHQAQVVRKQARAEQRVNDDRSGRRPVDD